jgi:D-sedoheptulose 7-phosphate isomerase
MDLLSDYLFKAPSADTPRIQECHMLVGHILCELVEIDFLKDTLIA